MSTKRKLSATPTWRSAPVWASTMIAPQPAKTRAKVPTNSAASSRASERSIVIPDRSARGSAPVGQKLRDQPLHTPVELVADPPHRFQILAGGVVEVPILAPLPPGDPGGVAAAHRD